MKIFTKIRRVFSESNFVQRKAIKKVDLVTMDLDYFKISKCFFCINLYTVFIYLSFLSNKIYPNSWVQKKSDEQPLVENL